MDAIIRRANGVVVVSDWAHGTRLATQAGDRPNYEALAAREQKKLNALLEEKKVLDKEFEELALQEEILCQAIAGVRDSLALLDEEVEALRTRL